MCSPGKRVPPNTFLGIYVSASTHVRDMCFRPLVRACMRMKQAKIFKTADERIKLAQQKQKEQYKKRKGIVEYNFKIGKKVLRRNTLQKTRKGKTDGWGLM